jgi:hypothetical protein
MTLATQPSAHRIAVLMAGPVRYAPLVVERLGTVLGDTPFEVFALVWKEDLGNKRRDRDRLTDVAPLLSDRRVSACIIAAPLPEDFYSPAIGTQTNSGSSINATMGMFYSMSELYHYVAQLPNHRSFTHALRIRTDCLIIADDFLQRLDFRPRVLTVSSNPFIPSHWLSDHLTFGTWTDFGTLWAHDGIESVYNAYERGERNPERTLARLLHRRAPSTRVNSTLMRFIDYHIVYSPPRDNDPTWLARAINEAGVETLFRDPAAFSDSAEVGRLRASLHQQQAKIDHGFRHEARRSRGFRVQLPSLIRRRP